MSHTPGKLRVESGHRGFVLTLDGDGKQYDIAVVRDIGNEDNEANARRLVACWNALDGISTEALEQSKPMAQLVIDHAMLIDALEAITTLLRGDGRFPATVAQLDITLEKHGRSA